MSTLPYFSFVLLSHSAVLTKPLDPAKERRQLVMAQLFCRSQVFLLTPISANFALSLHELSCPDCMDHLYFRFDTPDTRPAVED